MTAGGHRQVSLRKTSGVSLVGSEKIGQDGHRGFLSRAGRVRNIFSIASPHHLTYLPFYGNTNHTAVLSPGPVIVLHVWIT